MTGPDRRNIKINVTVDSDTRGSEQAAQSLEKVDKSAGHAEKGLAGLKKESESLDVQLTKTRTRVKELETELVKTGDRTTGRGSLRQRLSQERSWLRELERLSKSAAEAGTAGATAISQAFQGATSTGSVMPEHLKGGLIGSLVAVAAAAAPAIGAIISGAVAGTTVGGGIAGGVIAATADSRVRQAFKDLTSEFTAEAFGGGAFVRPVVEGLHILKDEFRDLNIDEALAKGASSVPILAQGIADMVSNIMPGFNDVMDKAEAFTNVFADGLRGTGSAVSSLLSRLVKSEGTIEGLAAGFKLLEGTIVGTGNILGWLADLFHDTVVIGAKLTGALEDIVRGAENVEAVVTQVLTFGGIKGENHDLSNTFAWMNNNLEDIEKTGYGAGNSMADFIQILRNGVDPTESQADALARLNDETERMVGLQASQITQNINFQQGLQDLADTFDENGATLDVFTDAGRKNSLALVDMAEKARAIRDTQIKLGGSIADANAVLAANKDAIYAQAEAAGIAKEKIDALILSLFAVPNVTASFNITRDLDESGDVKGKRALGGPVVAGSAYTVGENGPETFVAPGNGYIVPNGGMGGGMGWGAGGSTVTISFAPTGDSLLDAVLREIRKYIKVNTGGDVQLALGS